MIALTAGPHARTEKDDALEGLRGLAALIVVLGHFASAFIPFATHHFFATGRDIPSKIPFDKLLANPISQLFLNGALSVQIFFVISGYVLTTKFFATGDVGAIRHAAAKRYPRLAIPVLVSTIGAWALLSLGLMFTKDAPEIGAAGWPMVAYGAPIPFVDAIASALLGIPFFARGTIINSPLWTMYIEMTGSFILFATYAMFGVRKLLLVAIAFGIIAVQLAPASPILIYLILIFLGSLINRWRNFLRYRPQLSSVIFVAGVIIGSFDYSRYYAKVHKITLPNLPWPLFSLEAAEITIYTAVGAFLIVCGVIGSAPIARALSSRMFVYLGKLSFSLYLLHWPLICSLSFGMMLHLIRNRWSYGPALLLTFIVTLTVLLIASAIFERLVDRPSVRIANRIASWITRSNLLPSLLPRPGRVAASQ